MIRMKGESFAIACNRSLVLSLKLSKVADDTIVCGSEFQSGMADGKNVAL